MDHRRNGKKRNSALKRDENYPFSVSLTEHGGIVKIDIARPAF